MTTQDQHRLQKDLFKEIENIFLKVYAVPVASYENLTCDLFAKILATTDYTYHQKLAGIILEMMDALFYEKKLNRAEKFKNQILSKCSYLVSLLLMMSDLTTYHLIFQKFLSIIQIEQSNLELLFLVMNSIESKSLPLHIVSEAKLQQILIQMYNILMVKAVTYINDNKSKLEKSGIIQKLVLLMKPLKETLTLIMFGSNKESLPKSWRKDITRMLGAMNELFP